MDKMENEKCLSLEDTEQLCRLYLDCKLSLLEEAELHYVLGILPYRSSVIDEAKILMDISLSCAMECENQKISFIKKTNNKNTQKTFFRRLGMVAASIALIVIAGIPVARYINKQKDFYYQVFTNGKEMSQDKAIIIAEGELERIDNFFEYMENISLEQQHMIESL